MADYLLNVRVNWDKAGTQEYFNSLRQGLAQLGGGPSGDAREAAEKGVERNFVAQQLAQNDALNRLNYQTRQAQERGRIRAEAAAYGLSGRDERGRFISSARLREQVLEQRAVSATQQRVALLEAELREGNKVLEGRAREAVLSRQVTRLRNQQARQLIREQIEADPSLRGTAFQRLQAYISSRSGGAPRLPADYLTGRQFLASRALTTAGFALSGFGIYGAVRGVSEMVKQAQQLEVRFNQIQRQFESLGRTGEFEGFRAEILGIARDTGVAADEVAHVGFQLQGAFGGNTTRALQETRSAMEAVRVTGLEITEVIDAFTAITQSFRDTDTTIEQVTDKALGLQERFGVLAKETISFTADLAPVAAQMGFTVEQLEALGAVAQKYSGRSGASLAEAFGRVLPQIPENMGDFLSLFQQVPALSQDYQAAVDAFASGDIEAVLTLLQQRFSSLDATTKNYITDLLGGRREAQSIIAVLEHGAEVTGEYSRKQSDAGKTSQYFSDLQRTLAQRLKELGQTLTQLGVRLYEAGIGEILKDLAGVALLLVQNLGRVIGFFSDFNRVTHGAALNVLEVYAAVRVLRAGLTALAGIEILGGLGGLAGLAGGLGGRLGAKTGGQFAKNSLPDLLNQVVAPAAGGAAGGRLARLGSAAFSGGFGLAGLGGVALSPAGLVLGGAAAFTVTKEYLNQRNRARRAQQSFAERVKDADIEHLRALAKDKGSFFDQFAIGFLGQENPATTAQHEINRRTTPGYADTLATLRAGRSVLGDRIEVSLGNEIVNRYRYNNANTGSRGRINTDQLIKDVANGNASAIAAAKEIIRLQNEIPETRDKLAAALLAAERRKQGKQAAAKSPEARVNSGKTLESVEAVLEGFEAGERSLGAALAALNSGISQYEDVQRRAPLSVDAQKQLAGLRRKRSTILSAALRQEVDAQQSLNEVLGRDTGESRIRSLTALLQNTQFTDSSARQQAARDLADAARAAFDQRLQAAHSVEEEQRIIREGFRLPSEARVELLASLAQTDVLWQQFLQTYISGFTDVSTFSRETFNLAISAGITVNQAAIQVLTRDLAAINQTRSAARSHLTPEDQAALRQEQRDAQAALDAARAQQPGAGLSVPDLSGVTQAQQEAANERRRAEDRARAEARARLVAARAGGDPVAEAQAAIELANIARDFAREQSEKIAAEQAMVEALQQRDQAFAEINRAQRDLNLANVGDDPVNTALIGIENAREAERIARGAQARLQAQAERVRAERQLQDALSAIAVAQIDLAQAYADAAGNTVLSAQLAAQHSLEVLNNLLRHHPNDTEQILRAQADVVRTNAAVRDADLQKREEDIQFALDMEQITTGQAIAQFEALLQIPNLTAEQTRNILRTIKQLRDQLSQDLQFNLPTELRLPTLYEARRLNQGAGGYQDNRQVSVTMYISNGMDQRQAEQMLNNALGSNRYGFTSRRY